MKLYTGPLSLFARKAELALEEKGLPFERVFVPFSQTTGYNPKHPDVLAINPKRQVPVLIDGDVKLYDSTVILEYLEDAYPEPPLYPAGAAQRARCRLLDLYADETMLPPLAALMHRNTPGARDPARWAASEENAQVAVRQLDGQFSTLGEELGSREYFCGRFSVADISVFAMLFYALRLGGPSLDDHSSLAGWYRRLLRRPAFARIADEILAADREMSAPVDHAFGDGKWLPEQIRADG